MFGFTKFLKRKGAVPPTPPAAIVEAAELVGNWFASHGIESWELGPCKARFSPPAPRLAAAMDRVNEGCRELQLLSVRMDKLAESGKKAMQEKINRGRVAHELALRYYEEIEAFNRTVCTGPIVEGSILAANSSEHALIFKNALAVRERIMLRAGAVGISASEMQRAINEAACPQA